MHYNKTNTKGFTLIELMIVVVLIAISVGVTGDVLTSLVRSYNKTQVTTEIEQQANFLKLKLEKELRGASNVTGGGESISFRNTLGEAITYTVKVGNFSSTGLVERKVVLGTNVSTEDVTSYTVPGGANVFCGSVGSASADCHSCFTLTPGTPARVDICLVMRQASGQQGTSFTGKTILRSTIVARGTY